MPAGYAQFGRRSRVQDTIVEKVLKHPKYAELVQRRTRISMSFFAVFVNKLLAYFLFNLHQFDELNPMCYYGKKNTNGAYIMKKKNETNPPLDFVPNRPLIVDQSIKNADYIIPDWLTPPDDIS